MSDASEGLRLEPGERVLWQGRAAVGAPWPPVAQVLGAGLLALAVAVLVSEALDARVHGAVFVIVISFAVAVILASKLVGPSYLLISLLFVFTPVTVIEWSTMVQAHGPGAALAQAPGVVVMGTLVLGLPLVMLVTDVLARLDTVYVITDRRVAELRASRGVVAWECQRTPGGLLRQTSWRAPRGSLRVRSLPQARELHLRDDDPARVVADVVRDA